MSQKANFLACLSEPLCKPRASMKELKFVHWILSSHSSLHLASRRGLWTPYPQVSWDARSASVGMCCLWWQQGHVPSPRGLLQPELSRQGLSRGSRRLIPDTGWQLFSLSSYLCHIGLKLLNPFICVLLSKDLPASKPEPKFSWSHLFW